MSGKAHSSPHQAVPDLMSLSSVDRLRLEMLIRQQQLDQHFLLEQQQQQGRVGQLLAQHVSGSASGSATQFPMAAPAPAPALFNTGSGSLLQPQNGQLLAAILRQQTAQNLPAQHPNAALVNFLCQPAVPSQTSLETLFQYQQQQQEQQRHASLREEETLPNGQGQLLAALDQILKQSQGQVSSRSARRQIQANLNPTGMLLHGHQPQSLASTTEASALSALECMLRQQHNAHSTALSDGILFPGQHHNAPCNAPLARLTDLQSVLILQEEKDTTQQEKGMSLTGPSANASTSSAFASSVQPPEKDGSKSLIGNTTGTNVTASDDTEDVDKQVESCDLNAISENKSKYQEEKEEEEDPNSDDDLRANDAFPFKLYRILERASEDGTDCIISFFPHGCSFAIHKAQEFVTEILPKYFTSTRLSSFQRQVRGLH